MQCEACPCLGANLDGAKGCDAGQLSGDGHAASAAQLCRGGGR